MIAERVRRNLERRREYSNRLAMCLLGLTVFFIGASFGALVTTIL